jgi:hypothetical protein
MTISATTQGIKPGVTTSSNRPTVPFDGQVISETDTDSLQVYKGSAWAPVSGLTLISATTIGTTVASVTVSSAFSTTYDNYYINLSGGIASADCNLNLTLGATATGYYSNYSYQAVSSSTVTVGNGSNTTSFPSVGSGSASVLSAQIFLQNPFIAKITTVSAQQFPTSTTQYSNNSLGFLNNTTSYTAFTLTTSTGTMTGGTVRVYGYSNS